ncbi:MAG: glycosyltransferase family 1 protein [Cytophagales bacterium]|nr:glycosyltransferase family 1 protein [Cytophagales bacterium]
MNYKLKFDISNLCHEHITGAGIYTKELFTSLQNNMPLEHISAVYKISKLKKKHLIRKHVSGDMSYYIPELAPLFFDKNDIHHIPECNRVPIIRNNKVVITVHDMLSYYPEWADTQVLKAYLQNEKYIFYKAAPQFVICVSKFTEREFLKFYPHYEGKTKVVYHGLDHIAPAGIELNDSQKPYILYVGTIEKRKNVSTLIDAFDLFVNKYPDYELVIIGKPGAEGEQTIEKIKRYHARGNVHYHGYVSQSKLKAYYSNASLFVYPSLYEGFGFPILEAMKMGVPVVCSDTGAMAEIGGDLAFKCHAKSPDDICHAMISALENRINPDMYMGYAQQFTWQKCALDTIEAYNNLA